MAAKALLIVPPFIKYNAGPLLGPAMLQAAAHSHGHGCSTLDLNALWIQRHMNQKSAHHWKEKRVKGVAPLFQGDHNKPSDGSLERADHQWKTTLVNASETTCGTSGSRELLRRMKYGFISHDEVEIWASRLLSDDLFGGWAQQHLREHHEVSGKHVDIVGMSLLHAGQVVPAAALSKMVQKMWPEALVVWGGPHINGLGHAITEDLDKRKAFADVFVQGHAEETFVNLLDHLHSEKYKSSQLSVLKGRRGKFMRFPLVPSFGTLDPYVQPMTLPVQSSLGCAFGKCAFCTYPAMEGKPVQLSLQNTVLPMVEQAVALGPLQCSGISFKDSLVTTSRLQDIANCIQGRVRWSACTKLSARLSAGDKLQNLREGGLSTLEIGLESLIPETQRRIGKIHPQGLFESFVFQAATVPDLSVVVNYMTEFPWENRHEGITKLEEVEQIVRHHLGVRGKVEHNTFELERLSPMAQNPNKYGINRENLKTWPWASVIEQV